MFCNHCLTIRIQACPPKGITPIHCLILFGMGLEPEKFCWDREGSGFLGLIGVGAL